MEWKRKNHFYLSNKNENKIKQIKKNMKNKTGQTLKDEKWIQSVGFSAKVYILNTFSTTELITSILTALL